VYYAFAWKKIMATTSTNRSTYSQGHHESVLRSHASRTAAKDAAFLLPHIQPHHKILDVGCGPGTITSGFCAYVPNGSVTGVDASEDAISQARTLASSSPNPPNNLTFQTANILNGLPFPDATFDIIFTHQVLLHMPNHLTAIREMRRVCKPSGLLTSREGHVATFTWYPDPTGTLALWGDAMVKIITLAGGSPHTVALHAWFREAGLDPARMIKSTSTTSYSKPEERKWWGQLYKERIEKSDVREKFLGVGVTEEQLAVMGQAMLDWADDVDGVFAFIQYEVICQT
jgi:ubiquinone/menaquinone biosynthesis C-methylase UbiE